MNPVAAVAQTVLFLGCAAGFGGGMLVHVFERGKAPRDGSLKHVLLAASLLLFGVALAIGC